MSCLAVFYLLVYQLVAGFATVMTNRIRTRVSECRHRPLKIVFLAVVLSRLVVNFWKLAVAGIGIGCATCNNLVTFDLGMCALPLCQRGQSFLVDMLCWIR